MLKFYHNKNSKARAFIDIFFLFLFYLIIGLLMDIYLPGDLIYSNFTWTLHIPFFMLGFFSGNLSSKKYHSDEWSMLFSFGFYIFWFLIYFTFKEIFLNFFSYKIEHEKYIHFQGSFIRYLMGYFLMGLVVFFASYLIKKYPQYF